MVVKGTKRNRPKKQDPPERPSPTRCIDKIAALKKQPLKEDALDLLHELATLAAPLMETHGFHVGIFCEMFPRSQNLLGLNVNGGAKILIRLRHHHNNLQFISKSELMGTVLHELTHNKYGAHDRSFYAFLDKLTREFEDMMSRNSFSLYGEVNFDNMFGNNSMLNRKIKGDPYGGSGHRLGSKSATRTISEVNKLGGSGSGQGHVQGLPLRELILQATERRRIDATKCHEIKSQQEEIEYIKEMESQGDLPTLEDLDIIVIDDDEAQGSGSAPKRRRQQSAPIVVVELSDDESATIPEKAKPAKTMKTPKAPEIPEVIELD